MEAMSLPVANKKAPETGALKETNVVLKDQTDWAMRRRNEREKPKAAPAPNRGRGPGTPASPLVAVVNKLPPDVKSCVSAVS